MRSTAFIPLLLISTYAHSLPELGISKRDRHTNGATDHFKRAVGTHQFQKRQGTAETNIFDVLTWSIGGGYFANVTVGTPPQLQTVILDTGSSDTYFDASNAAECKLPQSDPNSCRGGSFDLSASTTYRELDPSPAFNTTYSDGSTAVGPFGEDVIGIGDVLVSPIQFGVAQDLDVTTGYAIGLLGIGYSGNEARPRHLYKNIPEVLVSANVINSRLYSVYLNDESAISGTLLFGGIDRSRFTGPMATIDLLPSINDGINTGVNQFITTITAANVTFRGQTTELWSGGSAGVEAYDDYSSLPVVLDTGSVAWTVPQSYYDQIQLGFPYVDDEGFCSCEHARSRDNSLSLEFGGKVIINIEASEFIVPYIDSETNEPIPYDDFGHDTCVFLIVPDLYLELLGLNFLPLGDAILRSMYVVFDLDNGQVSIAQAAINATSEAKDIVTVQAGPSGVASAISGVIAASPNPNTVAAEVQQTPSAFTVSTALTSIGTATGIAAIPSAARQNTSAMQHGTGAAYQTTWTAYQTTGAAQPSMGATQSNMGARTTVAIPSTAVLGLWMFGVFMISITLGPSLMT